VHLVADEDGRPAQELGRDDDDRGRAVADLLVLQLGQVDQDLQGEGEGEGEGEGDGDREGE
jgi:hypothetical protein